MLFNFVCYWLEALSQGNSARTCQGSFVCCSALSDMNTAQVRSSPLVLMSYKIGNGNSYHPPSRCSMNAKVPVMRSSSGRCLRKMYFVPAGTPGGACQVLPDSRIETLNSVRLFHSSHNWSVMCKSVPDTSTGSDTNLSQPRTLGGCPHLRAWWPSQVCPPLRRFWALPGWPPLLRLPQ